MNCSDIEIVPCCFTPADPAESPVSVNKYIKFREGGRVWYYATEDAPESLIDPETHLGGGAISIGACPAIASTPIPPITLPQVCANVDGVAMFVSPVAAPSDGAITYYDSMGQPITGEVTDADPCDCRCPDCPDIPRLRLLKQGSFNDENGDGFAQAGETINYLFTVINTGDVEVTGIVIDDPIIGLSAAPIYPQDLTPGESGTLAFDYIITQADVDLGEKQNVAIATGVDPFSNQVKDVSDDPTTIPNDDTVTPLPDNPSVALLKLSSYTGTGQPGDLIVYSFNLTNTGNVTLSDLVITDPIVNLSGGPIVSLAPGQTDNTTYSATYTLSQADIDSGQVINQAMVAGVSPNGSIVSDISDDPADLTSDNDPTVTPIPQNPAISLEKTASVSGIGNIGDTITWIFRVENTGNTTLTGVVVDDPAYPVSGGPLTLAPGVVDTTTFTSSHIITQADVDTGVVINQATVTGTPPNSLPLVTDMSDDPADSTSTDDPTVVVVPQAEITLLKTVDPGTRNLGDTISWTLTVTNNGVVDLTNVTVTDPSATITGGTIPLLPAGQTDNSTFAASAIITQADIDNGQFLNQATVAGTLPNGAVVSDISDDPSDLTSDNDPTVTPIPQNPAISLEKTASVSGIGNIGDTITWIFRVENTGNTTLTGVVVDDPAYPVSGGPITLAPGVVDATTFTSSHIITQADVDTGVVINQATVTGTPPNGLPLVTDMSDDPADSTSTDDPTVVVVPQAEITLLKTVDNPPLNVGDTISWTLTVTNSGVVDLTNVIVTDPSAIITGGPIPILPAGQTDNSTFTASAIITQADIDAGKFENQASAVGSSAGGDVSDISDDPSDLTSDNDPTVTPIPQNPAISLEKTASVSGIGNIGDTITWIFRVENTGNTTLTGVVVDDPAHPVSGGPLTLAPGVVDTTTFTSSHIITQADVDTGVVINQATVTGTPPNGLPLVTDMSDDPADSTSTDDPTVVVVPQAEITLLKTVDTGTRNLGDTISWTLTVTNSGVVDLTNVIVTDTSATITGGPIPLLPAGQTDNSTFAASAIITQADIDNGQFLNQATVAGTLPNGAGVSDISDDPSDLTSDNDPTVTPIPQNPAISLEKTASVSGIGNIGDTITWIFRVENTGNTTLTGVVIDDPAHPVSGGPLTLAPGVVDTTTFTSSHIITQADVDTGVVINQATVTGTPPNGLPLVTDMSDDPADSTSTDDPTVVVVPQAEITLLKTVDTGTRNLGDTISWTLTVTNSGVVDLTNVIVTDTSATITGGPIPLLPAGQTDNSTFAASAIITQADIDNGQFLNQATVAGTLPNGAVVSDISDDPSDLTSDNDPTVTPIPQNPAISLEKTASVSGIGNIGDTITWIFRVENTGDTTLTGVVIDDPAHPVSGGPLTLAPGVVDTTTFTSSHIITQADVDTGVVINQATVTGTPPNGLPLVTDMSDDPADSTSTDDPTVVVVPQAEITLLKTVDTGTRNLGDTISWTLTVTNSGVVDLTNVIVTDPSATITGGPIPLLPAGQTDNSTFAASAIITQADIDNGQFLNQATGAGTLPNGAVVSGISDDPSDLTSDNDPTVTPIPQNPRMELEKAASIAGYPVPGATINYAFSVANTGDVTLSNITLADPLPGIAISGGPIVSLAPGQTDSTTFTAAYTVTAADADAGGVANQATATASDPQGLPVTASSDDPATVAPDDSTFVSIIHPPVLTATKTKITADLTVSTLPLGVIETALIRGTDPRVHNVRLVDYNTGAILQDFADIGGDVNAIGYDSGRERIWMFNRLNAQITYYDMQTGSIIQGPNLGPAFQRPNANITKGDYNNADGFYYISEAGTPLYRVDTDTGDVTPIPVNWTGSGSGDIAFDGLGGYWIKDDFTISHYPSIDASTPPDQTITLAANGSTRGGGSLALQNGVLIGAYGSVDALWTIPIATGITTMIPIVGASTWSFDMAAITNPWIAGSEVIYEVEVCNASAVGTANNVGVSDPGALEIISDPDNLFGGTATIAPGACATARYKYTLTDADIAAGTFSNTALVTADVFDEVTSNTIIIP